MKTHIFDLDGTLLKFHTSEWLPGARKMLRRLVDQGDKVLFVTMRGDHNKDTFWSIENTEKILKDLDFKYDIVYGCPSPRILYDDVEGEFVIHNFNGEWR